jgi:hypothetical protein
MNRRLLAIIACIIVLALVAPIAFVYLEKPIRASSEELMVRSSDIPSWNKTSSGNWDVGLTLNPGAEAVTDAGFLNDNGSVLSITVFSFKSTGSAANSYPSMGNGATIAMVLNLTDEANFGWSSDGLFVGSSTTNTFYPVSWLSFRVQNVVVQMSVRFAEPGWRRGRPPSQTNGY